MNQVCVCARTTVYLFCLYVLVYVKICLISAISEINTVCVVQRVKLVLRVGDATIGDLIDLQSDQASTCHPQRRSHSHISHLKLISRGYSLSLGKARRVVDLHDALLGLALAEVQASGGRVREDVAADGLLCVFEIKE